MTKKCICQICSCGRHRCPHVMPKAKQAVVSKEPGGCTFSEYHSRYPSHVTTRGPFLKPVDVLCASGNMDFTTTNTLYHEPKDLPVPVSKPKKTFTKSNEFMDLRTEYDNSYVALQQKRSSQMSYLKHKTQPFVVDSAVHVVNSVSSSDYQAQPGTAAQLVSPPKNCYNPPREPFSEVSLHRRDFIDFKKPKSPHQRTVDNLKVGDGRFAEETTVNAVFVKHDYLPKIVKRQVMYEPNPSRFEGSSLLKADFPAHTNAPAAERASWNSHLFETYELLASETTNGSEFQPWPLQREAVRKPDPYRKPEGSMHLTPVSKDFRHFGKEAAPSKSMRPKTTIRLGSTTFHSKTAYQEVFDAKPLTRVPKLSRHNRTETYPRTCTNAKIDFVTESMASYKRFNTAPSTYTKEDHELFPNSKLDGCTTYCTDFSPKELKCPGKDAISNNFAGFNVVDDFESGHRYLMKKPTNSVAVTLADAVDNVVLEKGTANVSEPVAPTTRVV